MDQFIQQLINGLSWGAIYALIALGYTMVYGVLRLINFAHGDVYMVGAMMAYYIAHWLGFAVAPSAAGFVIVMVLSMTACALLGALIELVAYRRLRSQPRSSMLITAIGVSMLLEFGGQRVFGPDPKFFPQLIESHSLFRAGSVVMTNIDALVIVVSLALMIGLRWIVMKTRVGMALRAVSFSYDAAALMGIDVNRVLTLTFMLGSALAAAAGTMVGLRNPKIDPLMGLMPGVKAFVAAVLGGIGNFPGAVVGGLLMGLTETFVSAYLSSTYRDAVAFVILIGVLLVKPTGLFGRVTVEKV
ncbi:MAG: branched-chain amino acid ABC transporter permease [Deltaproteobacteria bacterium]|nr:branched-chain amino acid ABC transporter permease [Deltaproteobacteria bacterium]MBI3386281.1 branched-chain amino acid ABC transporter permease [Deltaproteobacteria bacterium]